MARTETESPDAFPARKDSLRLIIGYEKDKKKILGLV
jgi:hypothetical protein